ncbi:hypothetical protein DPMN_036895 [Dreissena polymorpha]|uniref:Uncharacterized protein n=1 Tax=Dreissena polymorpha TaxID=45954 RepID=A0A9D4RNK7_DREPO|nr:hypothetical protein DPMN_036895 [Dreissena polymorpha]
MESSGLKTNSIHSTPTVEILPEKLGEHDLSPFDFPESPLHSSNKRILCPTKFPCSVSSMSSSSSSSTSTCDICINDLKSEILELKSAVHTMGLALGQLVDELREFKAEKRAVVPAAVVSAAVVPAALVPAAVVAPIQNGKNEPVIVRRPTITERCHNQPSPASSRGRGYHPYRQQMRRPPLFPPKPVNTHIRF